MTLAEDLRCGHRKFRSSFPVMLKPLADAWALEVLTHIASREAFETTHIELKSQVVPPRNFAAQLGGLANAARWHPVLVLFGIDRRSSPGIQTFEVGDWYASLRASFEYGHAPELAYSNFVLFKDKTVGVLLFNTDNPPYVIGGGKKGGPRDVPWRYGSNTGSAGRSELLQMLSQKIGEPEIEVFKVELKASEPMNMLARLELFIYPAKDSELVIPFHRIMISASETPGDEEISFPTSVSLTPVNTHSSLSTLTDSAVVVPSPSRLQLVGFSLKGQRVSIDAPTIDVRVSILPAHFDHPVTFSRQLSRRDHPDVKAYWELPESHADRLRTIADDLPRINLPHVKSPRFTPGF
jgi:hypothetical protein